MAGAIDPAPRVVLQHVEDREQLHLREPLVELGADGGQFRDRAAGELARSVMPFGLLTHSTPTRYG